MFKSSWSKVLGGFVLGTVGVPLLKTGVAKKVYTYVTAGAFIAKDNILETAEKIQSSAMNISDDAKDIVEKYNAEKDAEFEAAAGEDIEVESEESEQDEE